MDKLKNNKVKSIVETNRPVCDGFLTTDRDGIIEHVEWFDRISNQVLPEFCRSMTGKPVASVYRELSAEGGPVFSALQNGEPTQIPPQRLIWRQHEFVFSAAVCPVSGGGQSTTAVHLIRLISLKNLSANEYIVEKLYGLDDIITANPQMLQLKEEIRLLSNSDSNTLIYGETGTGKELVAEAIHSEGKRRGYPFIAQNCAAIPENLMESLLFGVEKGSFTGAETKAGLFEQADGGTLFLDELNSMDIGLQAKLLKIIEEGKSRRIGGERDHYFDVRLIVATNEVPEKLVIDDRLRRDLYYRLNIARISIPPLRSRKDDIPLLSSHFIGKLNGKMQKQIKGLQQEAKQHLMSCDWPGNVRQLENVLESAFNLETSEYISGDIIQKYLAESEALERAANPAAPSDPSASEQSPDGTAFDLSHILEADSINLDKTLKEYESAIISAVLAREKTLSATAKKLQMSPQKLSYRMKVLDIQLP